MLGRDTSWRYEESRPTGVLSQCGCTHIMFSVTILSLRAHFDLSLLPSPPACSSIPFSPYVYNFPVLKHLLVGSISHFPATYLSVAPVFLGSFSAFTEVLTLRLCATLSVFLSQFPAVPYLLYFSFTSYCRNCSQYSIYCISVVKGVC